MGVSMRNILCGLICLVGLGCFVVAAQAGIAIQQVEREPDNQNPARRVTLYIETGKLRIEGANPKGVTVSPPSSLHLTAHLKTAVLSCLNYTGTQ